MTTKVADPVIEVHDLTVSYQRKPALWGVDFHCLQVCLQVSLVRMAQEKYFDQSNDGDWYQATADTCVCSTVRSMKCGEGGLCATTWNR